MERQRIWGSLVAWYLFLVGVGAGAYLVGVAADFLGEGQEGLMRVGVVLGPLLGALGTLFVLLDLGRPLRFPIAFLKPHLGTWIVSLFVVVGFIHLLTVLFLPLSREMRLIMGGVGGILALLSILYTGLSLGVERARPFWNNPMVPQLFLYSALSSGIGLVSLGLLTYGAWGVGQEKSLAAWYPALGKASAVLILAQIIAWALLLQVTLRSSATAAQGMRFLLSGEYALPFWIGVVVVGLIAPLVLGLWVGLGAVSLPLLLLLAGASGLFLLAGGLLMRYALLAAGFTSPLY